MSRADNYPQAASLFEELVRTDPGDPVRADLRDRLVTMHLGIARSIARKFRDRGEPVADLEQVAVIGLIKAVDRFDPSHGAPFLSFAIPTITGEVRRYFRDHGWAVRVPRRLIELHLQIGPASRELSQRLGTAPTPSQLAEHLGVTVDEVLEGLEAGEAYRASSLDFTDDDDSSPTFRQIGGPDPELDLVEVRSTLEPLLARISPREQRIVIMRFFGNLTQSEIARRVGLSQMQVSRLLSRSLAQMREQLDSPATEPRPRAG